MNIHYLRLNSEKDKKFGTEKGSTLLSAWPVETDNFNLGQKIIMFLITVQMPPKGSF